MSEGLSVIESMLRERRGELLDAWVKAQLAAPGVRTDLISESELRVESDRFLAALGDAVDGSADADITDSRWSGVREVLTDLSRTRAGRGFTPTETATFVFSLKQPLFEALRSETADVDELVATLWSATRLIDGLGLFTSDAFLRSREEVIRRQQDELIELSTPVVK